MATAVQVPGPCEVQLDTGTSHALESLGWSINGVEIQEDVKHLDVPGDQNGGDEGIPIDVQYLGEMHIVRMEMSKWDSAVADKGLAKTYGGTAGTMSTPGTLMSTVPYRLLLKS